MPFFKMDKMENFGENWLICSLGMDMEDGKEYIVTTDHIHASEYCDVSLGAKGDAELIAELLNNYYIKKFERQNALHRMLRAGRAREPEIELFVFDRPPMLICPKCFKEFVHRSKRKKIYCSHKCQNAAGVERYRQRQKEKANVKASSY